MDLLRALPYNKTASGAAPQFSPDGKHLAFTLWDVTKPTGTAVSVVICDVESGKELKKLTGHEKPVQGICFSPCGKWIASASHDKTVRIWDAKTGENVRTLKFVAAPNNLACSPDGKWLAVAHTFTNGVSIRDAATGIEVLALASPGAVDCVAFDAKSTMLAAAGARRVQVWELSAPKAPPAGTGDSETKKKQ